CYLLPTFMFISLPFIEIQPKSSRRWQIMSFGRSLVDEPQETGFLDVVIPEGCGAGRLKRKKERSQDNLSYGKGERNPDQTADAGKGDGFAHDLPHDPHASGPQRAGKADGADALGNRREKGRKNGKARDHQRRDAQRPQDET